MRTASYIYNSSVVPAAEKKALYVRVHSRALRSRLRKDGLSGGAMGEFCFLWCMSLCSLKNLCRAFITFIIRRKGSQKETGMNDYLPTGWVGSYNNVH